MWSSRSRSRHGLALLLAILFLASCGDSPTAADPDPGPGAPAPTPDRLVIEPGGILLPGAGATAELRAVGYDAAGRPVQVQNVTWNSSNPSVVAISGDGRVTAPGPLGLAHITATAGNLASDPVRILVAVPVDGAVLVPDSGFVGQPEMVDPEQPYGPGWRYRVGVGPGVQVEPGQILMSSGEVPVAGRVVEVQTVAGGRSALLELVELDELFRTLVFQERLGLRAPELLEPDPEASGFAVQRLPGGGLRFDPRSLPGTSGSGAWALPSSALLPAPEAQAAGAPAAGAEFPLGPFACKVEGTMPLPRLGVGPSFTLHPSFDYEVAYDSENGGLQRLVLEGDLRVEAEAGASLGATTGGKVSCARRLAFIRIPFPGPLGLFFGGRVDVKAGFGASGSLTLAEVGYKVKGEATVAGKLGVDCAAGCRMVRDLDVGLAEDSFGSELSGSILGVTEPFRVNFKGSVFGKAVLRVGHPFIYAVQAEMLEFTAGPAQRFNLATPLAQAQASDYRSTFGAVLTLSAGPGNDVEDVMRRLRISFVEPSVEIEIPLAASPRGNLTITPRRVTPGTESALGETATFTVELDDTSYLGAYAVEAVEILWLREDENGEIGLHPGRPGCTSLPAAADQSVFTCQTDFLEEHRGLQTFVAFVKARIFGIPVPVLLKVATGDALDGRREVEVGEAGHVALRRYEVYATAEVALSNTDGITSVNFVNEREVNIVTCASALCPRTGDSASASRSGSGSHEDVFASGAASGSASLAIDTTGVGSLPVLSDSSFYGAIRAVEYSGSANTEFNASGDLSRLSQRVVGTNGASVAFAVRGAPVRYDLSGSVEVGGYVEIVGAAIDDIVVRFNDGPPGKVASAGILPPGNYWVRGYALQARANANPFLTYGTGSVSFSLRFSPLEEDEDAAPAARRASGEVP